MQSIIQKDKECFFCGTTQNLHEHHILHGTSNRKNSENYGLKVWLCADHHLGTVSPHRDRDVDVALITMAQKKFEETHTREEFRKVFGKSYL